MAICPLGLPGLNCSVWSRVDRESGLLFLAFPKAGDGAPKHSQMPWLIWSHTNSEPSCRSAQWLSPMDNSFETFRTSLNVFSSSICILASFFLWFHSFPSVWVLPPFQGTSTTCTLILSTLAFYETSSSSVSSPSSSLLFVLYEPLNIWNWLHYKDILSYLLHVSLYH